MSPKPISSSRSAPQASQSQIHSTPQLLAYANLGAIQVTKVPDLGHKCHDKLLMPAKSCCTWEEMVEHILDTRLLLTWYKKVLGESLQSPKESNST
jgi:hypothetical protein